MHHYRKFISKILISFCFLIFISLTLSLEQHAQAPVVWQARLVEVNPQAVLGGGSIIRVYVRDRPGELIMLQQDELVLSNVTGTKLEYGPDVAEFAPIPPGQWLISLPALEANFSLQTNDTGLFIVEFSPVPVSQTTTSLQASITPTPRGGVSWQGYVVGQAEGPSPVSGLLRIQIINQPGIPINIRTATDFIGQGVTGNKPDDLASDETEIAGLTKGRYIITPLGLNISLTVDVQDNQTLFIEFRPELPLTPIPFPPTATLTPLPLPPTATATASATPPPTDTSRAIPNAGVSSILTIQIGNWSGIRVLVSTDSFQTECVTGTKPALGPGICEIGGLSYGTYTIQPEGLPTSFDLTLDGLGRAIVVFWQE